MRILDFFEERIKNLSIVDITLIKYTVFALALLFAKIFPVLLEAPIWVYMLLIIILGAKPIYVFYSKK